MLAGTRTDRPPTTPHPQPPERLRTDRSPLATALTDNLLGAFATTDKTQTTASTDHVLGVFGFTDHLQRRSARTGCGAS
ncbi:hypothetical protein K9N68_34175 (plasmid) [Kovacikia minuta CCNUW1]|uniref:hypothetical protein n=1 Tax=Kovacikia minuta TaxID=2931930 RepID=UPI001CC930A8|nr:hypothetical protein [Kovacikia minuta]UBF30266.1 hypothetical protein K9N68_34175 [Kovacikia minuta CCNUW1]